MEAVRIVFCALTIISATVCWCLAAGFLALTSTHLDTFWRGDVALLVFGILAMLILPVLMFLAFGHRRKNMTGPTIVEALTLFTFWCLFLAATAKFSATYHHLNGWGRRCRFGFSLCSTGRALLSFGWITFGLLSILLPICVIHGILHEKKRHREEGDLREGREIKPNSIPATSPQPAGGGLATTSGAGTTEGGVLNIGPLHPAPPSTQPQSTV